MRRDKPNKLHIKKHKSFTQYRPTRWERKKVGPKKKNEMQAVTTPKCPLAFFRLKNRLACNHECSRLSTARTPARRNVDSLCDVMRHQIGAIRQVLDTRHSFLLPSIEEKNVPNPPPIPAKDPSKPATVPTANALRAGFVTIGVSFLLDDGGDDDDDA
jgi:hypothetical protein